MKADKLKENSRNYFDCVGAGETCITEPTLCYSTVLKKLQGIGAAGAIADISCGTGEMLRMISDTTPEHVQLYGVDLSAGSIRAAARKLRDRAALQIGDVEDLPLDDQSVDIALNMHSLHHYPDPVRALEEIRRIIRPGGDLLLVENYYPSPLRRLHANLRIKRKRHKHGDVKMYSASAIEKMLEQAGYSLIVAERITKRSMLFHCRRS